MTKNPSSRDPKGFKINDQFSVDLDHCIDVPRLVAMHDELSAGIAITMKYAEPVIIGSLDAQFDDRYVETDLWLRQNADNPRVLELKARGFTNEELYQYAKYAHPTLPLGQKILLRTYDNYHAGFATKHLARKNHDTEAYKYFRGLRSFLEDSKIFSEIGRIIIFLTDRDATPPVHCDYADGKSRRDQFIWLNPQQIKKFFVLDEHFDKHYLTGVCNTFDSGTWHGGDPSPVATYTIRVDGVFNPAFAARAKFNMHFVRR